MSDTNGAKGRGPSFAVWGLAVMGTMLTAGIAYWARPSGATASSQVPIASTVRGSSFDAVSSSAPEIPKEESPAIPSKSLNLPPAVVNVSEPKALEIPVQAPLPKPEPQAPQIPAPAPPPFGAPAVATPVDTKPASAEEPPQLISFSKLAFRYGPQTKEKGARDPFPAEIRALNGKKIIVDGYMFPVDFEKGKVRSFLLSRAAFGCCYGDSPKITEIIKVMRADGKTMPYEAMASVTGILEVGEEFDSEGYIDSVYRIKADDVGKAPLKR